MTPEELEELKDGVKDAQSSDGFVAEMGLSKLEHFIKKHEPKPPWPPVYGQSFYFIDGTGDLDWKYFEADAMDYKAMARSSAFPDRKMAEFVRDRRKTETIDYWYKEMEK